LYVVGRARAAAHLSAQTCTIIRGAEFFIHICGSIFI
jgi:hypothetical protein